MKIIGDLAAPHMPPAQTEVLRAFYFKSSTILEYGAGGSTAMASDMPGKTITAVENDPGFVDLMALRLAGKPSEARLRFEDLGPCGKWGKPLRPPSEAKVRRYAGAVWEDPATPHPEVILIDGRCRVACFLASLAKITDSVTVLFDDWVGRPHYHWVAEHGALLDVVDNMAVLSVNPVETFPDDPRISEAFKDSR